MRDNQYTPEEVDQAWKDYRDVNAEVTPEERKRAGWNLLQGAFVLYMLIRHPGVMGSIIVISIFLSLGAIAWIVDILAMLILGHEIIGNKGK